MSISNQQYNNYNYTFLPVMYVCMYILLHSFNLILYLCLIINKLIPETVNILGVPQFLFFSFNWILHCFNKIKIN